MVGIAAPVLDVSELNMVLAILGAFILIYGFISIKIKAKWYLGEALPAVAVGVILGPIAARLIDSERWGSAVKDQTSAITLGTMRVMIGVQLVIAGFQLPAKYGLVRWKELFICLIPVMTIMWLCTSACIFLLIPKISFLAALVIGSCVTCTDPILSQAIAKGPFADKFVRRELREIISAEAGANDGFGFPFLMLATYLIRYADIPGAGQNIIPDAVTAPSAEFSGIPAEPADAVHMLMLRSEEGIGRLGGGVGIALANWGVITWIYIVLMSVIIGAIVGLAGQYALKFALRKKWVDSESYLLYPLAIGTIKEKNLTIAFQFFLIGICGSVGTDDLLACFVAGCALNWNGEYLTETEKLHDEVNSVIDVLLNFGGFMYIGTIMPWEQFNQPDITGLTWGRLINLGLLIIAFRRIPAILITYKLMPQVCKDYKEALFMGYFGPIGAGAVFYVEHTKHLFPEVGDGDEEETNLVRAMVPVVYFLVLFSIVWHGLSIPALNIIYKIMKIHPIQDDATEIRRKSIMVAAPTNAIVGDDETFIAFNRFSRPVFNVADLTVEAAKRKSMAMDGSPIARNRISFAPRQDPNIAYGKWAEANGYNESNRI
ncbi:putative Na(+)/H(+) antiporter [Paramyrothecium foliicola]|nr:putative Na(+)/H(+) antiporter [Paramyrothecium foliicola]